MLRKAARKILISTSPRNRDWSTSKSLNIDEVDGRCKKWWGFRGKRNEQDGYKWGCRDEQRYLVSCGSYSFRGAAPFSILCTTDPLLISPLFDVPSQPSYPLVIRETRNRFFVNSRLQSSRSSEHFQSNLIARETRGSTLFPKT